MSLVGPRPLLVQYLDRYSARAAPPARGAARHHRARPGQRPQRHHLGREVRQGRRVRRAAAACARPGHPARTVGRCCASTASPPRATYDDGVQRRSQAMAEPLVVVGAGGFGREVARRRRGHQRRAEPTSGTLRGVVDDAPSRRQPRAAGARRRSSSSVHGRARSHWPSAGALCGGDWRPRVRRMIADKFRRRGHSSCDAHPPQRDTRLRRRMGEGSVDLRRCRVYHQHPLGRHVHLNLNVTVGTTRRWVTSSA